jgi:hypothetical protein
MPTPARPARTSGRLTAILKKALLFLGGLSLALVLLWYGLVFLLVATPR